MSEHCGYVVKIENLTPHSNADRLQLTEIFGCTVIVGLDCEIGEIGVFFPTDLQLSEEYCRENDLVRRKDENGNNAGGYLDPVKRNIRAMRLRGEKSEGLFMPLQSLAYTGETKFSVGDKISVINGHEICQKYIPKRNVRQGHDRGGNKTRKHSAPIAPLFAEHVDTEQLAYNLGVFKPGDLVEITLKMHGTSTRTGYLPKLKGYKRSLLDIILRKEGTPIYEYGYITGTRRVVLNDFADGGYYGSNAFREPHAKVFEGKLHKGEEFFGEIVGFTDTGTPIMGEVSNKRTQDKEFIKQYGETTIFSYGCSPDGKKTFYGQDDEGHFEIEKAAPQSDLYIYRGTIVNEDGYVVEYAPDYLRYRCEQMGLKTVPVLWKGFIPSEDELSAQGFATAGDWVKAKAEEYYEGPDPIGKTHIREGVVVRIVNKPKFYAFKHKGFFFKVIEGILKDTEEAPDIEEAQELQL